MCTYPLAHLLAWKIISFPFSSENSPCLAQTQNDGVDMVGSPRAPEAQTVLTKDVGSESQS